MKVFLLLGLVFTLASGSSFATCDIKVIQAMVDQVCEMDIIKKPNFETLPEQRRKFLSKNLADGSCNANYVWVQNSKIEMVVHPIKMQLNGKDLKGYRDPEGTPLFIHFDEVVNGSPTKSGWVGYNWQKPRAKTDTPKISYVRKCESDLVAGSGVWVEDLGDKDKLAVFKLKETYKKYIKTK